MLVAPVRYIAVDWSGAAQVAAQRKHIVAAELCEGRISLSLGRTRDELAGWLIERAALDERLVVGLDFAFSYPAWFLRELGSMNVVDFWKLLTQRGETWLSSCSPPFWGRPRQPCPPGHRAETWRGDRQTERASESRLPSSPFQIGGAGAVGTGSLRGIPQLLTLREAGFSIWPFDPLRLPLVMEIYPRSFTGPVCKSSRSERERFLRTSFPTNLDRSIVLTPEDSALAAASEDAFDALCSVVGLERQQEEICQLDCAADAESLLEGAIFPGRALTSSTEQERRHRGSRKT